MWRILIIVAVYLPVHPWCLQRISSADFVVRFGVIAFNAPGGCECF